MPTSSPESMPWLDSYAPGVPHQIGDVTQTLPEMLAESVRAHGRKPALEFFGRATSYRALGDAIDRAAEGLRRLGVAAGDRVALILPNCPQHVVAFYAVLRLGAVVVEHNPLYTPRELRHQFEDHEARFAVVWDKLYDTVADFPADVRPARTVSVDMSRALPLSKRLALRLPLPKARSAREKLTRSPRAKRVHRWEDLLAHGRVSPAVPGPGLDDIAVLQYTSGTTGVPKGAVLTHANLRANAMQGRAWVPGLRDGEEVFYGVLPLFHAYGMTLCLTFAMSIGARLVLFPAFDVSLITEAARSSPPTFLPAVPPIYDKLARAAEQGEVDLRSVRFAISGAMGLPVQTVRRWEQVTGGLLVEGYGMTETSPVALGNPIGPTRRPGTVGVPFPSTDIRVVDPENPSADVPTGEEGELLIRGPQVFQGYWRRPDETAETLLDGGWVRTGDIVSVAPDGFVTIVDRRKELIITGGFNVAPSEVENMLQQHPDVEDAAVIAMPGGNGAEQVTAAVVLRGGVELDAEGIRDFCRTRLAAYKVPRRVVRIDDLPRSLIGKVLRREVRAQLLRDEA
ncbi:long-chain-fatty-acid--CoA ligase [Microbacterium xanthum]|uniref:long-chain-fatty-acid--CoA ligase n=1 Tax=Microbacterium xanthum TaxID=3079794 RepID=UPI002AD4BCF0|nr:long-chain-fatty-acid--CoA ligase [Microbacterium sp. KSW-48]MDZ8171530.1 long-chain-fatty-acid--CoA ligase [Microbacterium sp. KSW-48]